MALRKELMLPAKLCPCIGTSPLSSGLASQNDRRNAHLRFERDRGGDCEGSDETVCLQMWNVWVRRARGFCSSLQKQCVCQRHARSTELSTHDLTNSTYVFISEYPTAWFRRASGILERKLATGDFAGKLCIWDLENTGAPIFQAQAHASIINMVITTMRCDVAAGPPPTP